MRRGFSFVELLIVVAIAAVLLAFSIRVFSEFRQERALSEARSRVVSLLETARSRTLLSQDASSFGVHFTSTSTTLFAGAAFTPGDPDNSTEVLGTSVAISDIQLNGGGSDIVFKRLTGETAQYGEITVSLVRGTGASTTIVVAETGLIDTR